MLGGRSARSGREVDRLRFVPGSGLEAAEVEECGRVLIDDFRRDVGGLKEAFDEG